MVGIVTSKSRKRILGRTRSEQIETIRKAWGGHGGLVGENLEKCKYLERKVKEKYGTRAANFLRHADIVKVRSSNDKTCKDYRKGVL